MVTYSPRYVDAELAAGLAGSGAVAIRGPRACGKTATARQAANSEIRLDMETPETTLAAVDPSLALAGATPRLIDEWQVQPAIWNAVRHAVDDRQQKGQFILTGSATPADDARRHPGAGRIRSLVMRTMTIGERFPDASTAASIKQLIDGSLSPSAGTTATVGDYADWILSGGWPGFQDLDPADAHDAVISYLTEMSEHDYVALGGRRRDPRRFFSFLAAYAGVVAQPATESAIRRRIGETSGAEPAPATVTDLHDYATRLHLVEDQPAWSTALRSRTALIQIPKRQLADPSLAAALLGASSRRLLVDLETLGILFEAQAVHDLRVVAQANRARGVFHLRDQKGREEIDAVIELSDGGWVGIEVKLSHTQVDEAAAHLVQVSSKVANAPVALIVVIPTGPVVQRPDGVWVMPLASLRP